MAKKVDRSTLGYLGEEFQIKLVKCFFEDRAFFKQIEHVIDQNMFTTEPLRFIVRILKERYQENDVVSTYSEVELLIKQNITENIRLQTTLGTLKAIENIELAGIDLIEEAAEKFFKQQNLTKAINKAQDIIKTGDYKSYGVIEDLIKKCKELEGKIKTI